MVMIILGVVIIGSLFYGYVIYTNTYQGKTFRSKVQYEYEHDAPRVIELPENIEREKKRRHIR